LGGDHGGELDDQAGAGVEVALGEYLVEGEVVEVLDQLGVGLGEGGDVPGESWSWFVWARALGAMAVSLLGS
jgi:hypothetical protein